MHYTLQKSNTIGAGGSVITDPVSIGYAASGFSVYYEITGSGSVDIFFLYSIDGLNYVKDSRAVKRGLSAGSGILYFPVIPCDVVKVQIDEVGGASVGITLKIAARHGSFGETPVYDGVTNAINTIDYPHHELHSGSHFFIGGYQDLAINNVLQFTLQTPDTTKWAHWTWEIDTEKETLWEVYEGATIITPLSTSVTPLNSNRNSAKTSGLTARYEVHTNLAAANASVTVAANDLIDSGISGAGAQRSGSDTRQSELILKQNEIYVLRATANVAGYIDFTMNWYEHTNR